MKRIILICFGFLLFFVSIDSNAQDNLKPMDFYFPVEYDSSPQSSGEQQFRTKTVIPSIGRPWGIAFLPDGQILISEREGDLRLVKNGKMVDDPVSNVPGVYARGQGGLLDVHLHPDYEENGWIYLSYSYREGGGANTALMRARLKDGALVDNEVIFKGTPRSRGSIHFGSRIAFDRDGYLYFTIGERGNMHNAQKLSNHAGKLHRIMDDGSIPEDNPFVNRQGAKSSIFTYGNRNQQGLTMNPWTGDIWSHEHGPKGGDEVNIARKGENYGWPEITFGIDYDGSIISDDTAKAGMMQPVHYWDPSIAPSGMDFVNTERFPGWEGDLLVGSLKFGYVARCVVENDDITREYKMLEGLGRVRDVKVGPDGLIYVLVDAPSKVIRLLPSE